MTTEEQRQYMKAYYQAHRLELLEWHRKNAKRNRKKILAYKKRYYQKNKSAKLAYAALRRSWLKSGGLNGNRDGLGATAPRPLDVGRLASSEV